MCCGAPKYNSRRNQAVAPASAPSSKKVVATATVAAAKQKVAIGRKITQSRIPMGPQKLLPKYDVPVKTFK